MAKPDVDPKTDVDYAELGRVIEKTFVRDYIHFLGGTWRMLWTAFVRGIAIGFGTVIGGTLVVAALIWFLGYFDTAPIIGEYLQKISHAIETGTSATPKPSPTETFTPSPSASPVR